MSKYTTSTVGTFGTTDFHMYFYEDIEKIISPFHDVSCWVNKNNRIVNMVVEIPKGTQYKLEIDTNIDKNPIKHDIKADKVREVAYPYPATYGAIPQTWENPFKINEKTGYVGDNDPVDIFDIGTQILQTGDIVSVKILGVIAMIDENKTDWKIIAINTNDPLCEKINTISDVEKEISGILKYIFEFLRDYKIPDGKPANTFAFDGKIMDEIFATDIIDECHIEWRNHFI